MKNCFGKHKRFFPAEEFTDLLASVKTLGDVQAVEKALAEAKADLAEITGAVTPKIAPKVLIDGKLPSEMSIESLRIARRSAKFYDQKDAAARELERRKDAGLLPKAEPAPDDARLRNEEYRSELERMSKETGWAERGGHLVRRKYGERAGEEILSRTQWLPNAPWWPGRPDALNDDQVKTAIRKALAGEKLSPKEGRMVRYLLDYTEEEIKPGVAPVDAIAPEDATIIDALPQADQVKVIAAVDDALGEKPENWDRMTEVQKDDFSNWLADEIALPAGALEAGGEGTPSARVGPAEREPGQDDEELALASPTAADLRAKETQAALGDVEQRTAALRDRNTGILTPPEGTAPAREITDEKRTPTQQNGLFGVEQAKAAYNPNQLELVYDNLETRLGTTGEQRSEGLKALRALFFRDRNAGASLLGSALWRDFTEGRGADLIGQRVEGHRDLAQLAQVLRDPRFETLRIFFVRGGAIVGHSGISSRMPGVVGFASDEKLERYISGIREMKANLSADGYWMAHNHPSGRASPSSADVRMTKKLAEDVNGFRGHVIIDHNEYGLIDGTNFTGDTIKADLGAVPEKAEMEHEALLHKIASPADLAGLANALKARDGFDVLVSTKSSGEVQAIAEVPHTLLMHSGTTGSLRAIARVRRFKRMSGASGLALVVTKFPSELDHLIKAGVLNDAIGEWGDLKSSRATQISPNANLDYKISATAANQDKAKYTTDPSNAPLLHLSDGLSLALPQALPVGIYFDYGKAYQSRIVQGDRVLGRVILNWKDGKVSDLMYIETLRNLRGKGIADRVVSGILSHNYGAPLRAVSVLPEARGFWEKMGAEFVKTKDGEDGILSRDNYEAARSARQTEKAGERGNADRGKPAAFRGGEKGTGSVEGKRDQAVAIRAAIAPVLANWKNAPQVEVIGSMAEAPEAVRREDEGQRSQGATGAPEAFFHEGTVYLVASSLDSPQAAQRALFHEALGHYGLRGVFGEKLNPILDRVAFDFKDRVAAKAREYGLDVAKPEDRRTAAEEVLAEIAQSRPQAGVVKRLIAAIRQFLRDVGIDLKLSDNDLVAQLIAPARGFVERGAGASGGNAAFSRDGKPMAESQFYSSYYQHIDIRGRDGSASENRAKILRDGFIRSMNANALPASRGGEPMSVIDRNYRPKVGDTVYLIPKEGLEPRKKTDNGPKIKTGWKPSPREVVAITDQAKPMYDYYREAQAKEAPAFSRAADAIHGGTLASARNIFNNATRSDRTLNRLISKFNTPFHIAETHPAFKPVYEEAQNYNQDVSRIANETADRAPDLLPRIESFADFKKTAPSNEDIERAAGALYEGTMWGSGSPLEGRVWTDNELRTGRSDDSGVGIQAFPPMSEKQIGLYRQALASIGHSITEHSKSLIWRLAKQKDIALGQSMSLQRMADVSTQLADQQIEGKRFGLQGADEKQTAKLEKEIAELEAFKKSVADIKTKTDGLIEHGYFPAMRFGAYAVNVQTPLPGGGWKEEYFGRFETQTAANLAKTELAREYPDSQITSGVMNEDAHKLFQGLNLDALELFAEHMTDENGNAISSDPIMQQYFRVAATERSSLKRQIHRKGTPGFSTDVPRALAQFTVSNASSASRNYHAAAMLQKVQHIKAGDLQAYATRYVRYLQDPQEEAQALRGFMANYYILGSIAFGAVNMTQPVLMTAPYLTAYTSWTNAMGQLGRAAKDMVTKRANLTPDERAMYEKASNAGIVSPQEIHQIRAESRASMMGDSPLWQKMEAVLGAKGVKLPGKLLMRKIAFLWGSIYSMTEQFNRGTTFLAAYRIARANHHPDPYAFAKNAVDATQGVYARSNRPEVSRGPVGSILMTFKQFNISYLELAKRLYSQDKKAFAVLMLTLMALAGAEGLPFAEDIEDLIDTIGQWMGYPTNAKKALRRKMVDLLGPDIADVMLHGASAIPGVPIDVAGRMGMHNIIPGTAMLKASEPDKTRDIVELLGPAATIFKNAGIAAEGFATGQPGEAKGMLPSAMQNVLKAAEMVDTGTYRDSKGRKVMDVDAVDAFAKLVGFQPAKVARETRVVGQNQQDIALHKVMEDAIAGTWAKGIADKDPAAVAEAVKRWAEWNKTNPEFPISISGSQISRRVKELQMSREERFVRSAPKEIRGDVRQDLRQ